MIRRSPLITTVSAGTMLLSLAYAQGADWLQADPNQLAQARETQMAISSSVEMQSQFDGAGNLPGSGSNSPLYGIALPEIGHADRMIGTDGGLEEVLSEKPMPVRDDAVSKQGGDPFPREVLDAIPETLTGSDPALDEDIRARNRSVALRNRNDDPLGLTPLLTTDRALDATGGVSRVGQPPKPDIYDPAVQSSVEALNYVVNSLVSVLTDFTMWIKELF